MVKDYTKPRKDYTKPQEDYTKPRTNYFEPSPLHRRGDRSDTLARKTLCILCTIGFAIFLAALFTQKSEADVVVSQNQVNYCEYKAEMVRDMKRMEMLETEPNFVHKSFVKQNRQSHIKIPEDKIKMMVQYVYHPKNNWNADKMYDKIRQLCIVDAGKRNLRFKKKH